MTPASEGSLKRARKCRVAMMNAAKGSLSESALQILSAEIDAAEVRGRAEENEAIAKMVEEYGDSMLPIIKTAAKKTTPPHMRSQNTLKGIAIGASRIAKAIRTRISKGGGNNG